MTRKQVNYNRIVGRRGNDTYYILQHVYDYDGIHRGAVGVRLRPIPKRETAGEATAKTPSIVATCCNHDYSSLNDDVVDLYNAELPADHDDSEEAEFSECIGSGRCFRQSDADPATWDAIYAPDLLPIIAEYETPARSPTISPLDGPLDGRITR